jgi:hypothetical protein
MTWWEAARLFMAGGDKELGAFRKVLMVVGRFGAFTCLPINFLDDLADPIPGPDILTIGDDLLIPFGIYGICRVFWIRHKANKNLGF